MMHLSGQLQRCSHCGSVQTGYPALPHHLPVGTVLSDRFYVGAVLGQGGFGITYIGRDVVLDMRVAIKEYYPSGFVNRNTTHSRDVYANTGSPQEVFDKGKDRFLEEARTIAKFSGETGIVGVRHFFNENNTAYIVMDFLEGMTLKEFIGKNGILPIDDLLSRIIPIMSALTKIHDQGLIHRDISPDNIMLTGDGSLILLDFGAARTMSDLDEKSLSVLLKPGYAPEEQYRSRGAQGSWTDVYALCATIYKCITGITPDDATQRIFTNEVKAPSDLGIRITAAQEAALLKGMAVLQKNRYQSIDDLIAGLFSSAEQSKIYEVPAADDENRTVYAGAPYSENANSIPIPYTDPVPNINPTPEPRSNINQAPEPDPGFNPDPNFNPAPKSEPEPIPNLYYKQKPTPKPKHRKKRKIIRTLLLTIGSIIVLFIAAMWLLLGRPGTGVTINGTYYPIDSRTAFIPRAPEIHELQRLDRLPHLNRVALAYSDGLSNEALVVIGGLTNLEHLSLGNTRPGELPSQVLDLRSIASLNLNTMSLENLIITGLEPVGEIHSLNSLVIRNTPVSDLSPLVGLPALHNLTINRSVEDISTLSGISSLRTVNLNENLISDLSALQSSIGITSISADYNQLESLNGLGTLANLRTITATSNQISDISALRGLENLTVIDINDNNVSDISALSTASRLREFHAANNDLDDLTPLTGGSALITININGNNVQNLDFLYEHIYLSVIRAAHNGLTCIEGLTNVTRLTFVNFNNNQLIDIGTLAKSSGTMLELQLANNNISDISALSGMPLLTLLILDNNMIEDISPLRDSAMLRVLSLHNNNIESIDVFPATNSLSFLDISNNQISSIDSIANSFNVSSVYAFLDISSNKVSDITPIPNVGVNAGHRYWIFIHNNPINDFFRVRDFTGLYRFAFTYSEDADMSAFENLTRSSLIFYAVDTPLDKRVNMERDLSHAFINRVNFVSEDEITALKQEERNSILGLTDEESEPDNTSEHEVQDD
jgi:serine/threonine protein kinase